MTLDYVATKYNLLDSYLSKAPIKLPITRDDLAFLFDELNFNVGAEVGIEQGLYSEVLCKANPSLELYCIDPLEPYAGYREHVSKDKMNKFYDTAQARLKPFNCTIVRKYSLDAVQNFDDNSLDFVYIDANHNFQNTTNDLIEWSKKVKVGGIIAGHDFVRNKKKDYKCHVKDVVHGLTYAYDIKPWFVTSDKSPSYFWVKEFDL